MLLRSVEYTRPESVADAVAALASTPGARALAGGQSLINVLKHRVADVELLVDVGRLEELQGIDVAADGSARLGAGVTYRELAAHEGLAAAHPTIARVAAHTADEQVRSRGTLGGNLCYNDPGSNFPPLAVALGATCHVAGPGGSRDVAAGDFFTGHFQVALGPGELLHGVTVPALDGAGVGFQSVAIAEDSWALARAAAWVRSDGTIEDLRVVLGCIGPTPVRATAMEDRVRGGPATVDAVSAAAEAATEGIDPPSDAHASGAYRRDMTGVVARRAVLEAMLKGD
jgi:aerobic carbon-monoxide dehydrogenase medium subunit